MELPSDLDTYSQEESSSAEESKSEETREVESATEQKDVKEIKKGNKAEEPENRLSKEASPSLEQHEDEYFVHLSNAESDDELENQQKSEQFTKTEKILKEIAEETKPTMTSTPEQKKGDKKPTHIFPQTCVSLTYEASVSATSTNPTYDNLFCDRYGDLFANRTRTHKPLHERILDILELSLPITFSKDFHPSSLGP
ncbi:hypothetical protein JTB14_013280 [Gonioctena quinquepunctata]|nr:hypothetical protein JTB14_013280 [Gonioctena quinquepunctata]